MKNTLKLILAFVLGITLTSSTIYAARTIFLSEELSYDNSNTGLSSTTVKGALDELYSSYENDTLWLLKYKELSGKPTHYIYGTNYDFGTGIVTLDDYPTTPPEGKKVYIGIYEDESLAACINKNGKEYCIKSNNYIVEREKLYSIFDENECSEPNTHETVCVSNIDKSQVVLGKDGLALVHDLDSDLVCSSVTSSKGYVCSDE